eukprot:4988650-Lingulodinium_polyedra.AAC.1
MTARQLARVAEGNAAMRSALRILGWLQRRQVPWIFEHPYSSFCFKTEQWATLLQTPGVVINMCDQCRYGTPWRERARL